MQYIIQHHWRSKWHLTFTAGLCLGLFSLGVPEPVGALPGQTVDEVTVWIQAHPTLQPARGETLRVRKSDTPAHRFTFEALIRSPGQPATATGNLIRMEKLSFFDRPNGVSPARLQEALQVIYGPEIYQDYQQATLVYQYPGSTDPSQPQTTDPPSQNTSSQPSVSLSQPQGEVRQGQRYAYWLETAPTAEGVAYNGQISVFLIEDVERLVSVLKQR